ncbi:MAG: hypothetical protein ACKOX6_05260, partial [Bdellovibrio sp.]
SILVGCDKSQSDSSGINTNITSNNENLADKSPSSSLPKSCFTKAEIQEQVGLVMNSMNTVITSLPRFFMYKFQDYKATNEDERWSLGFEVNSYSPPNLTLEASGRLCGTELSEDAILLVLCHEVGHVAGGAPYKRFNYPDIPFSTELAADFFATSICMPAVLKHQDNSNFIKQYESNSNIRSICKNEESDSGKGLCARIALASLNLSKQWYNTYQTPSEDKDPGPVPSFNPPSNINRKVIKPSYAEDIHSKPQCRLDTYLAGLQCRASDSLPHNLSGTSDIQTRCGVSIKEIARPDCI